MLGHEAATGHLCPGVRGPASRNCVVASRAARETPIFSCLTHAGGGARAHGVRQNVRLFSHSWFWSPVSQPSPTRDTEGSACCSKARSGRLWTQRRVRTEGEGLRWSGITEGFIPEGHRHQSPGSNKDKLPVHRMSVAHARVGHEFGILSYSSRRVVRCKRSLSAKRS
jgi:hypothetical protein